MAGDNLLDGAQVHTKTGTVYAVSVSGPKMYDLGGRPWMKSRAEKLQLYQIVTIDGDTLNYEAKTADGKLFDEFELRKGKHGSRRLIERDELRK